MPWPEADVEPEPAVAPEESDFLALLAFFWSLFPALLSLPPEEPELAAAPRPLLVLDAVPELPLAPLVPVVALGLEVVALEPVLPVPLAPLAPLLPELLDGLGVFGGIEVDVPLPPAMPASLPVPAPDAPVAFWERTVEEGEVELLPAPVDWAMASEDTDAITTNDSVRSWVVKVIANSFN
ncbi:hypothetical protein RY831_31260 [Noviherbaspirillum sp. CPCC 100848]|uniref:Uncharacterized protein n=1 Tax=Noviherbaspirillum album TaxID=3080276 RepID=A0ABU6JJB6_9BURK|nr:hypothetical protein [Noviherbaspirillum sp. CPCC 100848]